jgi:hypothetical protein
LTPFFLEYRYNIFGGICFLHLQDRKDDEDRGNIFIGNVILYLPIYPESHPLKTVILNITIEINEIGFDLGSSG